MIKPQVPELQDILLRFKTPAPATLVSPPEVTPPSLLEEELPDEEEELADEENVEVETKLEKKMEMMNLVNFFFLFFLCATCDRDCKVDILGYCWNTEGDYLVSKWLTS